MLDAVIFRYANDGSPKGALDYISGVHDEDLDGSDKLTVNCKSGISKRDRLVWKDAGGTWHEHIVDMTERAHAGSMAVTEATCSGSISELFGVLAQGGKSQGSCKKVLGMLVSGTRWTAGNCDDFGTIELEVWHKNIRECINELCDITKGELAVSYDVDEHGVTKRTVQILKERGASTVTRQFSYGRNVKSVRKEVSSDEVYTAVIGYGAKLNEDDDSDYAERLMVAETDDSLLDRWGALGDNGRMLHNWMLYTDDACTDATFLRRQCKRQLEAFSTPLVCYEFDVEQAGDDMWRDVRLGNRVMCIDDEFGTDVELMERVSHITRSLRGRASCKISIGKRANPLVEKFKAQERQQKRSTGSTARSESVAPVTTNGNYPTSTGVGGDKWTHQIDGVTVATGTINFVTTSSTPTTPAVTPTPIPQQEQQAPETWGGGGNGEFSSSSGGGF